MVGEEVVKHSNEISMLQEGAGEIDSLKPKRDFEASPHQWQPIETAPQETAVLLWYPWKGRQTPHSPPGFIYIGRWTSTGTDENDAWRDTVDYELLGEGATHWMPLPAPPVFP